MKKRPNFLIFVTDQHRADHLGCYGNPVVRTPHIDALAADGTRFERNYVASPVCMPNRGSIMTGRVPSVHGARGNGVPLPLDAVTFADVLSEFGWRTALIGKSHLQNMEDKPPRVTPAPPLPGTVASQRFPEARRDKSDPGAYEQEMRASWEDPAHRMRLPFYGFQDVTLCNFHADECFGDWLRWLAQKYPEQAALIGRQHGAADPGYVLPQAWHTQLTEFQYPTHYIAEQTADWIRTQVQTHPDQPFAVMCSFPDPHHPWTPPGKYWGMYDPASISAPASARSNREPTAFVRWLAAQREAGRSNLQGMNTFAASEREIREAIALTYGMITNIDDRIGLVMKALRDTGADKDTVVIFTSDHGDLMGDHGLLLKGPLHYQGLIRVPLIWRDPHAAGEGAVRDELTSTLDLAPSILTRAGIAPTHGTQGTALFSPDGTGRSAARDAVFIEEHTQTAFFGFKQPLRVRTIVTPTHRLTVFEGSDQGELYDLSADSQELTNLWDEPRASGLKLDLLQQLTQLLIQHTDLSPSPTRLA